jgi:adenylate kinase
VVKSWTVKIAGISGTGKTTVMEGLRSKLAQHQTVIYSALLKQHGGDQALADIKLSEILSSAGGLVLMDDHLEFDNPNKTQKYLAENTRGLVLLDVPLRDLLKRIVLDPSRSRDADPQIISQYLNISREKAVKLSQETKVPLLVIPNLEGEIERSIAVIAAFVVANSP